MQRSPAVDYMRDLFRQGNCKNISNGSYGTIRAYAETFYDPCDTSFQVGGMIFSVTNLEECRVKYHVFNQASLYSLLLHFPGVPHKLRSDRSFPYGGNINQVFEWIEKSPCRCCK